MWLLTVLCQRIESVFPGFHQFINFKKFWCNFNSQWMKYFLFYLLFLLKEHLYDLHSFNFLSLLAVSLHISILVYIRSPGPLIEEEMSIALTIWILGHFKDQTQYLENSRLQNLQRTNWVPLTKTLSS
jgi:hypothetical protein